MAKKTAKPERITVGLYVTNSNAPASAYLVSIDPDQRDMFESVNRHRYLLARSQEELLKDLELLVILGAMGLLTEQAVMEATGSLDDPNAKGEDDTGALSPENQEDADWLRELAVDAYGSLVEYTTEVPAITDAHGAVAVYAVSL